MGESENVSAVDLTQVCKHTKRGHENVLSNFHTFLLDSCRTAKSQSRRRHPHVVRVKMKLRPQNGPDTAVSKQQF